MLFHIPLKRAERLLIVPPSSTVIVAFFPSRAFASSLTCDNLDLTSSAFSPMNTGVPLTLRMAFSTSPSSSSTSTKEPMISPFASRIFPSVSIWAFPELQNLRPSSLQLLVAIRSLTVKQIL